MNDLEWQIRELTLTSPSEAMDQRVLSILQTQPMSCDIRRGIATTVAWMVAAASLLIGIVIGRVLPTSMKNPEVPIGVIEPTPPGRDRTDRNRTSNNVQESPSRALESESSMPEFPESIAASSRGAPAGSDKESQIADPGSLSLRDAVLTWERQTGQIFNVATHVHDRRFNMCRECHRIGG